MHMNVMDRRPIVAAWCLARMEMTPDDEAINA